MLFIFSVWEYFKEREEQYGAIYIFYYFYEPD